MKTVVNFLFLFQFLLLFTSCGTREFLGFEEKKIKLPGKRVSILKEGSKEAIPEVSQTKVELEELISKNNWMQTYNSPTHESLNFKSNTNFSKIKIVTTGAGESSRNKILSQPVIYNDNIYFIDADSNIISYSLINKKTNWKKNITLKGDKGHSIGGGLAVYKNKLLVNSPYGEIICLSLENGNEIWLKDIDIPIRSSPTIFDNKVFSLTLSNKLMAIDIDEGTVLWEHQGIFNNTTLLNSPKVAVDDNIVIAAYSNGDYFGLNSINGKQIWRNTFIDIEIKETTNSFTDIDAIPVIKENFVILASAIGKVTLINKKTGSRVWTREFYSSHTPAVNGNSVFLINNNKEIFCLDLISGGTRWSMQIDEKLSGNNFDIWYSPILINNKLMIVGGDKKILIIDPYLGSIEKIKTLSDLPSSSPFVVKEKLYLMLKNGDIVRVE